MKKIFAALLLAGMAFSASAAETIRFASSATYPPFESLDENNQFVGFDIDLVKALCAEMKVECTFTNQAFDSLIASLKMRRYDAVVSGMDITEARSKQVLFSDPYYANSAILISQKGKFSNVEELNGKRVGMENGTTHQRYLQDNYKKVMAVPYDSYQNALIDLKNGRLDAVFGDTAVVNQWLKENPELATVGEHITDAKYFGAGLGIAVNLNNKALQERINNALAALKENGTYGKINDKWFPQ